MLSTWNLGNLDLRGNQGPIKSSSGLVTSCCLLSCLAIDVEKKGNSGEKKAKTFEEDSILSFLNEDNDMHLNTGVSLNDRYQNALIREFSIDK
ncbi:hypothetical protein QYM36_007672 [Artemia franciscana]|uniref:Uncharacterized protein n=1 Tax=Artemia franciscana TaxID=6661 RepID=A0AA88IUB8_ARTSF|nr:hypothetical protein QYM36_007672 [Artemia franciscana]